MLALRRLMLMLFVVSALVLSTSLPAYAASSFVAADGTFDAVLDESRDTIFMTSGPEILRYSISEGRFLEPFFVGGSLQGIDISADRSRLVVADARYEGDPWDDSGSCSAFIHLVNVDTGELKTARYETGWGEIGSTWAVWGADDRVYVMGDFGGISGGAPMRRYDPTTNVFTQARWHLHERTLLFTGADRSKIFSGETISNGEVASIRVTDGVLSSISTGWYVYQAAASRDSRGFTAVQSGGKAVQYIDGVRTRETTGVTGVAYSPFSDRLYHSMTASDAVIARAAATGEKVAEHHLGRSVDGSRLRMGIEGAYLLGVYGDGVEVLHLGDSLVGRAVSAFHGVPVDEAVAEVWREDGGSWQLAGTAEADDRGFWRYPVSSDEPVRLRLTDPTGGHEPVWVGGGDVGSAQSCVPSAQTTPVLQTMQPAATGAIAGTVRSAKDPTPLAGIEVRIYSELPTGYAEIANATTDDTGAYRVDGLAPGRYTVGFHDPEGVFIDRFSGPSTSLAAASPLTITPGGESTQDGDLPRIGSIAGTITSTRPLSDVVVTLYSVDGGQRSELATTAPDASGASRFSNMEPGSYVLGFADRVRRHVTQFTGAATTLASATPFTVEDGEAQVVDVSLEHTPYLQGRVRDTASKHPLAGIEVRLYDASKLWDNQSGAQALVTKVVTKADGTWEAPGLTNMRYVVGFCDTTQTYRDMTFPQMGLRLQDSYAINPTTWSPMSVDCDMMSLARLKATRTTRVAGPDRYSTAIQVSRRNFSAARNVVIVSGTAFPDALSAAPLAGALNAPMLLTPPAKLQSELIGELERLGVENVFIVGGTSSVSASVQNALAKDYAVIRFAGADRYSTSALVAKKVVELTGPREPFVCRGDVFADALSLSPFSYAEARPILLTSPNSLPKPIASFWKTLAPKVDSTVIVVGGPMSVTDDVLMQLAAQTPTGDLWLYRFAGDSRYGTCLALIRAYQEGGWRADMVGVASGETYADALAGGIACGYRGGVLFLTPGKVLLQGVSEALYMNGPYVLDQQIFGGKLTLSDGVKNAAEKALGMRAYDFDDDWGAPLPASVNPLSLQSLSPGWATMPAPSGVEPRELELELVPGDRQHVEAPR